MTITNDEANRILDLADAAVAAETRARTTEGGYDRADAAWKALCEYVFSLREGDTER